MQQQTATCCVWRRLLTAENRQDARILSLATPLSDDDRNVEFSQTVNLVRRLRANKVYFEEIVYPDEVHDFLLYKNWVRAYRASVEFFDRHLK